MEDMELKQKVHEAYEGTSLSSHPEREQLVYEIIKLFKENNVSIIQADSILSNTEKVIKIISTV